MSETLTSSEVVMEQQTTETQQPEAASTQLQASFWGDEPSAPPTQQQADGQEPPKEEPKPEPQVVNEWYKNYGWENEEAAKTEIEKLKQVKPQEEVKWANEDSRKVHELLREGKIDEVVDIYNKQKQLDKYITGEVNPTTAEGIIKLQMKMKYPTLSEAQIDFQYNEDYGTQPKPVQKSDELDDEYEERLAAWQATTSRVDMKKTIAATMAIPELQKLKTEIVLPDTSLNSPNQVQRQLTQEEIAADKQMREQWVKAATSTATEFKGFSTTAKYKDGDKEVEIPVSYGLSDEERKVVTTKLSTFVENNFNLYDLFKDRWVDENGNDKINQMVEDISWLMFGKNAATKFANDASNQRMENYLRDKKNIRVDGGGGKDFGQGVEQKSQSEKLQEVFWNS